MIDFANGSYFEQLFSGDVAGHIIENPRGTAGFGYDPVFVPTEGDGRSFAETTLPEKNGFSHRARAVAQLTHFLRVHLGA